jgi:hypothetical protein
LRPDIETADIAEDLKATVGPMLPLAFILLENGRPGKFTTYYGKSHVFMDAEINLSMTIAGLASA